MKHIEKDPALERRFRQVKVPEPTVDETREILHGLRERYETHKSNTPMKHLMQLLSSRISTSGLLFKKGAMVLANVVQCSIRERNF